MRETATGITQHPCSLALTNFAGAFFLRSGDALPVLQLLQQCAPLALADIKVGPPLRAIKKTDRPKAVSLVTQ
jgi:hypothetical protein